MIELGKYAMHIGLCVLMFTGALAAIWHVFKAKNDKHALFWVSFMLTHLLIGLLLLMTLPLPAIFGGKY